MATLKSNDTIDKLALVTFWIHQLKNNTFKNLAVLQLLGIYNWTSDSSFPVMHKVGKVCITS